MKNLQHIKDIMKKILLFTIPLVLLGNCGKSSSDTTGTFTSGVEGDSLSQNQTLQDDLAAQAAMQQALLDSIRQDSVMRETARQEEMARQQADRDEISSMLKKFYEGAVIGCRGGIPWTESSLSRYCTKKFIRQLRAENDYDDGGIAVWVLRGDCQDSDCRDHVSNVNVASDNSAIVTYTDCGYTCKTKVFMVKDAGQWKINGYKFISQSSTSKYSEFNGY